MVYIKGLWYIGIVDYIIIEIRNLIIKYNKLQDEALTSGKYELVKAYSNVVDNLCEILAQVCNNEEEE